MSRACPLFQASAPVVLVGLGMLVLGTVAPSACAAQFPPLPFVVAACVRTATPPVLEGKLDEACWQQARPMRHFLEWLCQLALSGGFVEGRGLLLKFYREAQYGPESTQLHRSVWDCSRL